MPPQCHVTPVSFSVVVIKMQRNDKNSHAQHEGRWLCGAKYVTRINSIKRVSNMPAGTTVTGGEMR